MCVLCSGGARSFRGWSSHRSRQIKGPEIPDRLRGQGKVFQPLMLRSFIFEMIYPPLSLLSSPIFFSCISLMQFPCSHSGLSSSSLTTFVLCICERDHVCFPVRHIEKYLNILLCNLMDKKECRWKKDWFTFDSDFKTNWYWNHFKSIAFTL